MWLRLILRWRKWVGLKEETEQISLTGDLGVGGGREGNMYQFFFQTTPRRWSWISFKVTVSSAEKMIGGGMNKHAGRSNWNRANQTLASPNC